MQNKGNNRKRNITLALAGVLTAASLSGCGSSFSGTFQTLKDVRNAIHQTISSSSETVSAENGTDSVRAVDNQNEPDNAFSHFYYDQLSDAQKETYRQLYSNISARKKQFNVNCERVSDIETCLKAVMNDHPEFFWINSGAEIYGARGGGREQVTLTFNVDESEIDGIRQKIDACVRDFESGIGKNDTTYSKVRAAYEYIIYHTDYRLNSSQDQNIQSVFLNHYSVCAGYSKAFQYLLHQLGIPCTYVSGTISDNGASHAWNLVQIDGVNTYVDVTWGDPTYQENQEDSRRLKIVYDYLCFTTDEMNRSGHVPDPAFSLPDCTSTTYDFYRRLGDYFTSYDGSEIQKHLYSTVRSGESITYLKFASDDIYQRALSNLFGTSGLIADPLQEKMTRDGTGSIRYYYSKSDEFRTIKIFW